MTKITVDGVSYEVDSANNLLQECLSQGLDLPYFCWHPCLGSVGACRQCAVKQYRDEDDKTGTLVMACMTPVVDGARVSIDDEQAKSFRASVIESLMTSHPHDCPVCEEGGECHLQDMTQMSGHNYRRYDKQKVTHHNQDLGPFINHEMNRCITCYRCVRFYDDYAGGTDLAAQASHHHTYFGRFEEGTLESEFSGNLVEVCPTGVFTDKPFSEHYTRKWDLQTAPSVCTGCSVGCNITPGERYGSLRRVVNRYHHDLNGYFLCDRGRYGAHYVNSEKRLRSAKSGEGITLTLAEAESRLLTVEGAGVIAIGSPRASNEANFALRSRVGAANYFSGHSDADHESMQVALACLRDEAFHCPTLKEIERADAVLILGEDVTNTAPRVALALRQSVRNKSEELAEKARIPSWQDAAVRELAQEQLSPLALFSTGATRLDDIATQRLNVAPSSLLAAADALCRSLSGAPVTSDPVLDSEALLAIASVSTALQSARRPLVIAGVSAGAALMRCAANIARALSSARAAPADLVLIPRESNSVGHALMVHEDNSLGQALAKLRGGQAKKLIVLENDLTERAPSAVIAEAFAHAEELVVIDQIDTATARAASLVLPSSSFTEYEGTRVNYEGRAQLSFQVGQSAGMVRPAEHWLGGEGTEHPDSLVARCAAELPDFGRLNECLPTLNPRVPELRVPRQSHRYSGRTAINAADHVHESKQPVDEHSVMSFSMEGGLSQQDSRVLSAAWAPQWNSNQSISKFQSEINGELKQGHAGAVLIARDQRNSAYQVPARDEARGGYQLVMATHIFGSEALSAHSPAIQERMCDAYVALAPAEARLLGGVTGSTVEVVGTELKLILIVREQTPRGVAMVYPGSSVHGASVYAQDIPVDLSLSIAGEGGALTPHLGFASLIVGDAEPASRAGEAG